MSRSAKQTWGALATQNVYSCNMLFDAYRFDKLVQELIIFRMSSFIASATTFFIGKHGNKILLFDVFVKSLVMGFSR